MYAHIPEKPPVLFHCSLVVHFMAQVITKHLISSCKIYLSVTRFYAEWCLVLNTLPTYQYETDLSEVSNLPLFKTAQPVQSQIRFPWPEM